uniref:Putative heat shock factor hsf-type dna-binding domain-containing protein n=2 Tax=Anopheles triannulatus TaxID=58253 RepID=A0A2M4ABL3_9DIPT
MICKEDVVNWFRDLKSYNRIDTMCVLLNMCLPFELRFLGTYLEELGRRDGPELRGAELKVNNPQEFIADIAAGEPTDWRIRRKMALFLALFRTCNHTYANELFKTLEGWGARGDLQRVFEEDVLQELLLVYTMATNHPVFSFEQRLHCGEIFTKLKSSETKPGSQRLQDKDDTPEHQHPQHHQQHHTTQQHHQHHQHQSQHQSLDSLQSNSPQQSPIQQQQQQHHQQQSQHQPPHLQNSTPPPVSSQLTSQMASGPDTVSTPLHQTLPPNAPMSLQIVGQSGVPTTMALSYTGQPALTQVVGTGMDVSLTAHYLEPLPPMAQLPLQPDFTIPPPGPNTRWAAYPVYHPMYPPPASSPHMSNPSSPIQSRTTSPTRIHPSSVQHRISRNQQNDQQQQQQQQQNQAQVQNLKSVDEDQTTLMMSQVQLRNGMRQSHNTLPRQSKQGYVNQLPSYHHQQQQQQQQQHHSQQRGDSSGSGSYHTLNYGLKGAGMMMDMMNHQSKSTGSDSGSSIGSDVSPPETPGVVPVSGGGSGGGGAMGSSSVPHVRSSNRSTMRTINGRLEKPTYSQLQQQQQFAGSEGLMVVTSGGQNFLTTGTTNGAAMSSNGNNGASGSGVVSGPLLINPAAAAGTAPPNPGSTGTGTSLLLSAPAYATGPYAGSATAYQVGAAPHLVTHRQIAGATITHAGTAYRPSAYPPSMQPSTADGLMYPYHTTTVLPPSAAGTPGSVGQASSLPFLPPPTGPGGTTVGTVAVASTQTSLPNLRSSPSQPSTTAGVASSSIGLLQTGKAMTIPVFGPVMVGSSFGVGGGSCYNCGSQKHTGLDCPEASMEDMTRNSNFTLDYNTTSSSGPSSVTLTTSTSTVPGNNNSSSAEHHGAGVIKLDRDNSSSSSSTGSSSNNSTSSSGVGTGSTQMSSTVSSSSNSSNSSNNNNNNGSNSSNNSNNSSLDVPSSSPTSSSIAVAVDSGNSGVPGVTGSSSNSSNTTSSSSSSGSGGSANTSSSSNSSNLVNVSGK